MNAVVYNAQDSPTTENHSTTNINNAKDENTDFYEVLE